MIGERVLPAVSLELRLDKWGFIQVLAFLLVFIHPEVREHLGDLVRHQTAEDGITGILGSRRQDAIVQVLVNVELFADLIGEHPPLVVAEVVEHHEEHLPTLVQQGEHLALENLWRQHRTQIIGLHPMGLYVSHPIQIVLPDELSEAVVRIFLLHLQHLRHAAVRGTQFQFPVHQTLIDVCPVLPRATVLDLHGYLLEILLILALRDLRLYLPAVDILLQGQQDLVGIDGFDEVVGNLLADGLFHNVLLLALRHHDDRE